MEQYVPGKGIILDLVAGHSKLGDFGYVTDLPLPPVFLSQCLPGLAHPPISSPGGGLRETQDDCGPACGMLEEETGPPHGLVD